MLRPLVAIVVISISVGLIAGLGYGRFARQADMPAPTPVTPAFAPAEPQPTQSVRTAPDQRAGNDPAADAASIEASQPTALALPALRHALSAGDLSDRTLALRALRDLAQRDGDADGGIRAVLREAIYHGDDDATMRAAQATLDGIEADLDLARHR